MTQTTEKKLFEPKLSDFQRYDFDHPKIWLQFQTITFDLINHRVKHYDAEAIFEIIRYSRIVKYGEAEFKVDSDLAAYYAEKFINRYPQPKGFFETDIDTAVDVAETPKGFIETELKLATDILDLPDVKNYQSSGSYTLQKNTKRFIAAAQRALAQIKRGRKDKENERRPNGT